MIARIVVTPKPVVNDPQGITVRQGLATLGFREVSDVRIGKYIEVNLEADSEYEALQATVEKRFASGLSFNGNYTWQHARADLDGGTAGFDKSVNYGPNDNYRNHVFIFTQVYQLPFGRGKKYASNVGKAADLLIGGWELNGTTNFSTFLVPGIATGSIGCAADNPFD